MVKYQVKHVPISWPRKCAACGALPTAIARSQCSVVTNVGYYVLFVRTTHLKTSIEYPVCARHRWAVRIAAKVSERNLFNLALGMLIALFAFGLIVNLYDWLIKGKPTLNPETLLVYLAIVLGGVAVYILAARFTPVKLNGATKETITLSFSNDDYAKEFAVLNQSIIIQARQR